MSNAPPASRPVYIIDDNTDLRKSLHFLLATANITAWPFATAEDFFDHLPTLSPGLILLDVRMAGMDGLQALRALRDQSIQWPVIVMTAHGDVEIAVRAMKLGAIEFLEKPFRPEMLDEALAHAFEELEAREHALLAHKAAHGLLASLSARETEVMTLLVEGLANKIVAHRLGVSPRTVEMHRRNALGKLRCKSIAEVVALVADAGTLKLQPAGPHNEVGAG